MFVLKTDFPSIFTRYPYFPLALGAAGRPELIKTFGDLILCLFCSVLEFGPVPTSPTPYV